MLQQAPLSHCSDLVGRVCLPARLGSGVTEGAVKSATPPVPAARAAAATSVLPAAPDTTRLREPIAAQPAVATATTWTTVQQLSPLFVTLATLEQ